MATNRRSFLKTSGLAALASTTALSGCSGILGGGGGGAGGSASFLYDPATLLQTQNKFYGSLNYAQLYQARQNLPQSGQSAFQATQNSPVSPEDIDTISGVGGAKVPNAQMGSFGPFVGSVAVVGSFQASDLTSEIQSSGQASQSGEYQGYTLYESRGGASAGFGGSGSATLGITDGSMVVGFAGSGSGSAPVTGNEAARTMIDASNGSAPGLFGNSQYLQQLSNQFGQSTMVFGAQIDPALLQQASDAGGTGMGGMGSQFSNGMRAFGLSMQLNGQTTTFKIVGVYKDAQTAQNTQAVALINQMSTRAVQQSPAIDSVNASYSGSAVVITLTGKTKQLFQQGMGQVPMGSLGGMGQQTTGTTEQQTSGNQQQQTQQQQQTPVTTAIGNPKDTVRGFYQALANSDAQAANMYIHPESPVPEMQPAQMPPESAQVRIESSTVVEQSQQRAVVRATVVFTQNGQEQTNTVTIELRPGPNGRWLIYSQQ